METRPVQVTNTSLESLEKQYQKFAGEIEKTGVAIIPGVFSTSDIEKARNQVLQNIDLMKNTRPSTSSRHLAGFHRYPRLESLHLMMTTDPVIQSHMEMVCGVGVRTIGLSDITLNRSQQWHKDLLRGQYRTFMSDKTPCATFHGKMFKAIVYLQDSNSLKIIPGSHKQDISLDNDDQAIPEDPREVQAISATAGDVVVIDICTTHRGTTEAAYQSEKTPASPRILISTVFGAMNCEFTDNMETGNAARLRDWMARQYTFK